MQRAKLKNPVSVSDTYQDVKSVFKEALQDLGLVGTPASSKKKGKTARRKKASKSISMKSTFIAEGTESRFSASNVRVSNTERLQGLYDNDVGLPLDASYFIAHDLRLGNFFKMFARWEVKKLAVHWVPQCPATTEGYVNMVILDDPDTIMSSIQSIYSTEGSVTLPLWKSGSVFAKPGKYYVGIAPGSRETCAGILRTSGDSATQKGYLMIEYDILFSSPINGSSVANWRTWGNGALGQARMILHSTVGALTGFFPRNPVNIGADGINVTLTLDAVGIQLPSGSLVSAYVDGYNVDSSLQYCSQPLLLGTRIYWRVATQLNDNDPVDGEGIIDLGGDQLTTQYVTDISLDPEGTRPVSVVGSHGKWIEVQDIIYLPPYVSS